MIVYNPMTDDEIEAAKYESDAGPRIAAEAIARGKEIKLLVEFGAILAEACEFISTKDLGSKSHFVSIASDALKKANAVLRNLESSGRGAK